MNQLLTTKQINEYFDIKIPVLRRKFEKYRIKPFKIEKNKQITRYYYTITQVCFVLGYDVCIPIIKKKRKPYFEFSTITKQSKINGTN